MKTEVLKILYIEDNPDDEVILRRSLEKWSGIAFQMEIVETGARGLKRIVEEDFNLIILDYNLPDMNGDEVLNEINARGIKVPVIILTGAGDLQLAVEAMKKGVYDYVTKDLIDTPKLANSIHELLLKFTLPEDVDIDLARKVFELLMTSSIQTEAFLDVKSFPSLSLSSEELISTLNALNKAKFVTAEAKKTILACPKCNSKQMEYEFECPRCGNPKIVKEEALEHYPCGHIDFLSNFQTEKGELKCPKCMKDLRRVGTDYRKAGTWYKCSNNHFFGEVVLKFKCQKCSEYFELGDAFFDYAYEYHLDLGARQKLGLTLKAIKAQPLLNFIKSHPSLK